MSEYTELEIFSDLNCAWCYFDKISIKKLIIEYEVKVIWRAFPLHPDIPVEGLRIENLFGDNLLMMHDKMQHLENIATSLGLPLSKRTTISDSRLAQELAKWAETKNKLGDYHDAVYKAYFADGLNIAEPSVLLNITDFLMLSREEAQRVIENRLFRPAVDNDWKRSKKLNIMVAPTYLLKQDKLVGSQSYNKLENLLQKNGVIKRAAT